MNLITDPDERQAYRQAFFDLHDTFSRPVVMWQTSQQTILSTDPSFNGFYPQQQNPQNVIEVKQSGVFNARIKYLTAQEVLQGLGGLTSSDTQPIDIELGAVRMRVDVSGFQYMKDAKEVTFDDQTHRVFQRDRGHGLFDLDFYDFILQRIP